MGLDVAVSAELPFPPALVAAYTADPDHDTTWYANIREVEWLSPRPLAVGSRVARVASFLGMRIAYTYVVRSWEPGRSLVLEADDAPFPMRTAYTWEEVPGGTRMEIRNTGGPTGLLALTGGLMAARMRRELTADLARLGRVLSQRPPNGNDASGSAP